MIILPSPPRLASLRSFWLAFCFMVTVLIGMLAWVNAMIALLGVPVVALLGLAWSGLATDRDWTVSSLEYTRSALHERCRTPRVVDLLLDSHGSGRVDKDLSPVGAAGRGGVAVDTPPKSPAVFVQAAS